MLGFQKLVIFSLLCVTLSMAISDSKEGFLWKLFNQGKNIFNNMKNSERRKDSGESEVGAETGGGYYSSEDPEHRGTDSGHQVPYNTDPYRGGYYGHTQVVHGDNMELYSLLGGLSFASLLATTLVILTRRNGSLLRSSPDTLFRKNTQEEEQEYEMVVRIPQFMYRIGRILNNPWWSPGSQQQRGSKSLKTVTLEYPEQKD